MKKLSFFALALAAVAFAATGCKNSGNTQTADTLSADSIDSIETAVAPDTLAVSSVVFEEKRDSTAECSIRIDFPTGSDEFSQAVRDFIAGELASVSSSQTEDGARASKKTTATVSNLKEARQLVNSCGKKTMKRLVKEYNDMAADMQEGGYSVPQMSDSYEMHKVAETSKYVTYLMTGYTYLGGAHGSSFGNSVNISKVSRKPITQSIVSGKLKALQPILRKGVVRYMRECGMTEVNNKNLNEYLLLSDESKGLIPLPANAPYVDKDSLCFIYQQYEIAPYAMGLVSFNVSLKEIKPFLTKEVRDITE